MLTVTATKQLVQALVISSLDYCNSLQTGIPTSLMSRLKIAQHKAAHLNFRFSGHQSVTVLRKDLHWLPVTSRVLFKVLVLVYKCRNGLGPEYMTSMLSAYTPVRGLCSASYGLLVEPRSRLSVIEPSQLRLHMSGTVSLVRLETVRLLVRSRES